MRSPQGIAGRDGRRAPAGLAALVALAALTFASSPTLADESYTDPVGDVTGGAGPDIVSVAVSEPDSGRISFAVEFANDPPLAVDVATGSTDMLMILLDTGQPATSEQDADYATGVHGANQSQSVSEGAPLSVPRKKPDGTWDYGVRMGVVAVAVDGQTVTLTIPLDAIGNPDRLRFELGAGREGPEGTSGGGDRYPEQGWQTYVLTARKTGSPVEPWSALAAAIGGALVVMVAVVVMRRRRRAADASESQAGDPGSQPATGPS